MPQISPMGEFVQQQQQQKQTNDKKLHTDK